jgi:ribose transport system substrate-binding protein
MQFLRRTALAVTVTSAVIGGCLVAATASIAAKAHPAKSGYKLALIPGLAGDPFYITMECGAKAEAKKLGDTLTYQGPSQFEPSLQIPIVNSVTATHPAAMLVAPTDTSALFAPLKAATQDGIKLVLVDTTLKNTSIAASRVSSNNVLGGEDVFKALKQLDPKGGDIMALAVQPGVSTNDERLQGFEEAAKKDPKFHFVGVQYDNDETSQATQETTAMLQKYPNLVGIFGASTYSVDGAVTGLRQAGKSGKVSLVGFDAEPAELAQLKAGTVQALIAQQPYTEGEDGVIQAVNALNGKPVTKVIATGTQIITKTNLKTQGPKYAYKSAC